MSAPAAITYETATIHDFDDSVVHPNPEVDDSEEIVQSTAPSSEPETDEEETEQEEETPVEEEAPAPDEAAGDDPDLAALGFPELPAELQSDEAVVKRYAETQRGIAKLLDQAKTGKETVDSQIQTLTPYVQYAQRFEDPAQARDALFDLARELKIDLTGVPEAPQSLTGQETTYEQDLANVYAKAKADAVAEFKREFGPDLEAIRADRAEQAKQKEFETRVEKESKSVIGYLARTENGWGVTKEMVAQAMREMPNVDPAIAVKRCFPDEFAQHKVAKAAAAATKRGPEMPSGSGTVSRGKALPDKSPVDMDIHEIDAWMKANNS